MSIYLDESENYDIKNVLNNFKIKYKEVNYEPGKFFDIYKVHLSDGSPISKLEKHLPDIGLALYSKAIPRGYPVFSQGYYQIEVQKSNLPTVKIQELLPLLDPEHYASVVLGINKLGEPLIYDLHTLPNLLIGGTTGSGKSMLLNSIILSLIKQQADLFLIDPKLVEFSNYKNIRAVKKIGYGVQDTLETVEYIQGILDYRFKLLSSNNVRNILEYNKKYDKKLMPIVLIIDEWADLVLQDKNIQNPVCLLAQKGRAAGISVIIATQRPTTNVISGLIKANFSGRISMKVVSGVDSRVILEQMGGEKITGVGEGLFLTQYQAAPTIFKTPIIDLQTDLVQDKVVARRSILSKIWPW